MGKGWKYNLLVKLNYEIHILLFFFIFFFIWNDSDQTKPQTKMMFSIVEKDQIIQSNKYFMKDQRSLSPTSDKTVNGDTPLHTAARRGKIDLITHLVRKQGADINAVDNFGNTPLHSAVHNGHFRVAKLLVDLGANVRTCDKFGNTPLFEAVCNGSRDLTELLLKNGANVNTRNNHGNTPIFDAVVRKKSYDIIKLLVEYGSSLNTRNRHGMTPIHDAVCSGSIDVVKTLIALGADVNARNRYKMSPLQFAVRNDQLEICKLLLSNGADVNVFFDNGNTILFNCSNPDIARLLLLKGVDVNQCNHCGISPMFEAIQTGNHELVNTLLEYGAVITKSIIDGVGRQKILDVLMNKQKSIKQ